MTTLQKGKLAESLVMAEAIRRGFIVSVPFQEDCSYDLILDTGERLLRVQVKYTKSDGNVIKVSCQSCNNWQTKHYDENTIDAFICYDATAKLFLYLGPELFRQRTVNFRLEEPLNNQVAGVRFAKDHLW